jgi:transcription initiation factor TFIIIB Brf1 subunit/transcription initiation factor TFIIB
MEIEQSWLAFDSLRKEAELELPRLADPEIFCHRCGGVKSYGVHDDVPVCTECGACDVEYVCEEAEWRSGCEDGVDQSRVGAPVNTDHFSAAWGQGTIMNVQRSASYAQKRLARINFHSMMNHRDRALFHAYADLDRIGKQTLGLPEAVMYQAKIKYKAFNEAVLTRGAVRNGIKANCIFQACREFNVPRTTREIAEAFGIPARDISRTFEIYQEQVPESQVHVTTPSDLVARFFKDITGVPEEQRGKVCMRIRNICKQLEDCVELMGRTPKAVVCSVMYIVLADAGFSPNKAELCRVCDVSVPTLGKIEAIIKNQLRNS